MNSQVMNSKKLKGKLAFIYGNTYKGDVHILTPPLLLPAIRYQQHNKRAHTHVISTLIVICDLNYMYKFEFDWLTEPSNNKLSDNNLASELVEKRTFFYQSLQSRNL